MCSLKRDMWKTGIPLAGLLLFLVFIAWAPMSVGAHEGVSRLAIPGTATAQLTPTEDATVTALNKEKLGQEVNQLQHQNERSLGGLFWNNAATVFSTAAILLAALFGIFRWWFGDRRAEREKRAEERFQAVVVGLGSKDIETKVGSAILLRTFLRSGYEEFYRQVFELTVAHLRLRKTNSIQSEQPSVPSPSLIVVSGRPVPRELNQPIDSLSQALISAFKLSFPLAREQTEKATDKALFLSPHFAFQYILSNLSKRSNHSVIEIAIRTYWVPQNLDAANIQLEDASLFGADLAGATLTEASLQRADLYFATLSEADLREADLSGARLAKADLSKANLNGANLRNANIQDAQSLRGTYLLGVKGLTKEQLLACKAKGAIIDEDTTTNAPQPTVSPPTPSQQSS
jgi:Pentapeptide repeats (8 copies)